MKQAKPEWPLLKTRVHAVAKEQGVSLPKVAEEMGVSKALVYSRLDEPDPDPIFVRKLANALGVSIDYLWNTGKTADFQAERANVADVSSVTVYQKYRDAARGDVVILPVWRGAVAGLMEECVFVPSDESELREIPAYVVGNNDPEEFVVCQVAGLSMAKRIVQGDSVIVRLRQGPPPNTLVLAENPERQKYLKVFRVDGTLHSINPDFPPIVKLDGWQILGYAVAIFKPYDQPGTNIEFNDGRPLKG